jgi:hypothetical protein
VSDGQHGSPSPPQALQPATIPPEAVSEAVQPLSTHCCSPTPPQEPFAPTQLPSVQVPSPPAQAAPLAVQTPCRLQQPSPAHQLPSQHGSFAPPHWVQPLGVHTRPEAVQKSLPRVGWQQAWLEPPQLPQLASVAPPVAHLPRPPVQSPPLATQVEPEQQPAAPQSLFSQQG